MKNTIYFLAFLLTGFLSLSFSTNNTHSLTINVNSLRNSDGVVLFLLYNEDGAIPDKDQTKYYIKKSGNIAAKTATITFNNLPEGKYAVNIIHDENDNGVIDMGYFLPKEGIGFSNFKKLNMMNRPSFSKASFDLDTDTSLDVKTIYM